MIAGLLATLAGSAWGCRAAGILLAGAAILLFMVSLRRAGEKAGRAAEQVRAAGEVEALPEGAMLVRMLSDYAVLRDQARACR